MSTEYISTPFGEARTVSVDDFLSDILPPLRPSIEFNSFIDENLAKLPVTKSGRLAGYSTKTPSQLKGRRTSPFRSLALCAKRVSNAVEKLKPTTIFRNNNSSVWDLDKREEASLPDAYLVDKAATSTGDIPVDWSSIAVPGVYSKSRAQSDRENNIVKITRCMAQCMHHDPRRRFVYGFCIDDSTMTLWYCDRAQIVVSDDFDFVENWRTLFRFLLSMMYAEPHHLGFDPTMARLENEDGTVQYDIMVRTDTGEELVYRTIELLSTPDVAYTVGRGTRVWKAIKTEHGHITGEPVALKDCWVDSHREREGIINARIRAAAILETPAYIIPRSLLTVLCHGDVVVSGIEDRTRVLQVQEEAAIPSPRGSSDDGSLDASSVSEQVHYRIVFQEIGRDLNETTSLCVIFRALMDAANGLMAMHASGWVHGDVSLGNILLYEDWAKLGDLEHATREGERTEHDRMGTSDFIAEEVREHAYLYLPDPIAKSGLSPGSYKPVPPVFAKFTYNPIHDLESLWWIAIHAIVTRRVVETARRPLQTPEQLEVQRRLSWDLFWDRGKRELAIRSPIYFRRHIPSLHPMVREIAYQLDDLRQGLMDAYCHAEFDMPQFPPDIDITQNLGYVFGQRFDGIRRLLESNDVEVCQL